eukprot:CAMPEP_0196788778 /NCGR_PEP_ID=MMETSP1104-20130614/25523_1 /TAXON_ID=33652 /ORGANISM="Cafeteria sp., Strain Caron Lab Isolate" /LENGTH=69 /DNA_ID=CAMNT_0042159125 /DNA_START=63 /DNA_END=272 /DNA_ORIENTATION=-
MVPQKLLRDTTWLPLWQVAPKGHGWHSESDLSNSKSSKGPENVEPRSASREQLELALQGLLVICGAARL